MFSLQGKTQYLVLWEDYSKEEASWVVEDNITDAAIRLVSTIAIYRKYIIIDISY